MIQPAQVRVLLALMVTGSLLGLTTVLAKVAVVRGVPPLAFLAWSGLGAALILSLSHFVRGKSEPLNARTLEYFSVAGALSFALPNALLFSAIPHVGAGFASLALAFPPTLTYVGAVILGMDRFDRWRVLAVTSALAGAGVLAVSKGLDGSVSFGWLLAVLVVPVILASGNLYRTLRWPAGASASGLAPGVLAVSALMLITAGLTPIISVSVPKLSADAVLLLALQSSVFAAQYVLFFYVQKSGGPVYLSLIGSVAAIVAVPLAVLTLDEGVPPRIGPAAVLILTAVALMVWRAQARSSPSR